MDDEKFFQLANELADSQHRQKAIRELAMSGDVRSQSYLIQVVLDDKIPDEDRAIAITGLYSLKSRDAVLALRRLLTTSNSPTLTVLTIFALGVHEDTDSGENIVGFLSSNNDEGTRYTTAQALGMMKYLPAIPHLIRMLQDPSEVIRNYACSALINMREARNYNEDGFGILAQLRIMLLNDPSKHIRERVRAYLTYIDSTTE